VAILAAILTVAGWKPTPQPPSAWLDDLSKLIRRAQLPRFVKLGTRFDPFEAVRLAVADGFDSGDTSGWSAAVP
jgi:hypothetical protein